MKNKEQIAEWFRSLQDKICTGLEELDGLGTFREDIWYRDGGGGGRTRIINGNVIQKGGVNFSAVEGQMPEKIAKGLGLDQNNFFATGVSIVLHPINPYVPIIHMNVRYFETDTGRHWFGGGIDLTPHYIFPEDAKYFHTVLKNVCDQYSSEAYGQYKKWADDYFYLKHRGETRGVGGIFFDRLEGLDVDSKLANWEFVKNVGESFLPIYFKMVLNNNHKPYADRELKWQKLRRGRYVEFNLLWDKGTKFGLDSNGRTESILMSLPPEVSWEYDHVPDPHSQEIFTSNHLVKDIDWVNYKEV